MTSNLECKVEKRIHHVWQELEDARKNDPNFSVKPIMEKYQYLFSKGENTISLVQFTTRMYGKHCWEIYQVKGKQELFEDVERFTSKEESESRIKELLS